MESRVHGTSEIVGRRGEAVKFNVSLPCASRSGPAKSGGPPPPSGSNGYVTDPNGRFRFDHLLSLSAPPPFSHASVCATGEPQPYPRNLHGPGPLQRPQAFPFLLPARPSEGTPVLLRPQQVRFARDAVLGSLPPRYRGLTTDTGHLGCVAQPLGVRLLTQALLLAPTQVLRPTR